MSDKKHYSLLESFAGMTKEEQAIILITLDKQESGEMTGRDVTITTKEFETKLAELQEVEIP